MAEASEDVQEPGFDPQIRDLAGWAGKAIYWTVWPIGIVVYYIVYYIAFAVLFVLKLVYRPLEFILLPIFYLLSFILNCLLAPFQFLAKFEVLLFPSQDKCIPLTVADPLHLPRHRSPHRHRPRPNRQLRLRLASKAPRSGRSTPDTGQSG